MGPHLTAPLRKLIEQAARRHHTWEVFRDFCELSAIAISNAVDRSRYDPREKRYLEVVRRYDRETEIPLFPRMLAELTNALGPGPEADVLGQVFGELELDRKWHGQFFTPMTIALAMAKMMLVQVGEELREKPFVTLLEPCVGSGVMVIAAARAFADEKLDFQRLLHATCVDTDVTAVHMAYVQLSLLGIPAVVIHGNSLSLEEWSRWVTPAHVLGGWSMRLAMEPEQARQLRFPFNRKEVA